MFGILCTGEAWLKKTTHFFFSIAVPSDCFSLNCCTFNLINRFSRGELQCKGLIKDHYILVTSKPRQLFVWRTFRFCWHALQCEALEPSVTSLNSVYAYQELGIETLIIFTQVTLIWKMSPCPTWRDQRIYFTALPLAPFPSTQPSSFLVPYCRSISQERVSIHIQRKKNKNRKSSGA